MFNPADLAKCKAALADAKAAQAGGVVKGPIVDPIVKTFLDDLLPFLATGEQAALAWIEAFISKYTP